MKRRLPANCGRVCALWKCVASAVAAAAAADDDGDDGAELPYHCHGDPSRSLGAETVSHRCHGGGECAARIVRTFPV